MSVPETAIPRGAWNRAALPVPFALPGLPASPAIVVITPPVVTWRIVWLPVSATQRLPPPNAIPWGAFRSPTAIVVTTPDGVTLRTRLFPASAT